MLYEHFSGFITAAFVIQAYAVVGKAFNPPVENHVGCIAVFQLDNMRRVAEGAEKNPIHRHGNGQLDHVFSQAFIVVAAEDDHMKTASAELPVDFAGHVGIIGIVDIIDDDGNQMAAADAQGVSREVADIAHLSGSFGD